MSDVSTCGPDRVVLEPAAMQQLIDVLRSTGYQVHGPVLGNGAVVYDELSSVEQFPAGRGDQQQPGRYRLTVQEPAAWFGYTVAPQGWKRLFFPPATRLWRAERKGSGMTLVPEQEAPPALALIGVRACELAAIAMQDRVFMGGPFIDPAYKARRDKAFIVAVNCGRAGETCFCASMGTGPAVGGGFDIAMTELMSGGRHRFVAEAATGRGAAALAGLAGRPATTDDEREAAAVVAEAATHMGRAVHTEGLAASLMAHIEHPRWDQVGRRCLSCANCTLVCPTCFCATVEDETDLTGAHAARWKKWDSCFTLDFSYIHGGSVRPSPYARYRQWLIHKFSSWVDQFGTFGCVGCGRCITWCPVGIDVTEELQALEQEHPTATEDATA